MTSRLAFAGLLAASAAGLASPSLAQSMSPMRGEVTSFTDAFAVRVFPANPYERPIGVDVRVYDQDFAPVAASVMPGSFTLAAGASRSVLVVVPFAGASVRKIRICTESVPFPDNQTRIRAQICGKFIASRR
jgi:hypothetical protein